MDNTKHTVNKTLQGHILEHVFGFVRKVCFVPANCFTHPLKTKVFTNTLRLQNNATASFPRTKNHSTLLLVLPQKFCSYRFFFSSPKLTDFQRCAYPTKKMAASIILYNGRMHVFLVTDRFKWLVSLVSLIILKKQEIQTTSTSSRDKIIF